MNMKPGTPIASLSNSAGPSGLAPFPSLEEESQMKLSRTARGILSVTALAWAIPLAHAEDQGAPRAGVEDSLAAPNCASVPSHT